MLDSTIKQKEFKIEEIFTTIYRGKNASYKAGNSDKQYPYIGAAYNNNGVVNFVDYSKEIHITKGNSIVFIATGEGSVGYAVYKKEDFIASKNVFVGSFKNLTKNIGNYLVTLINNQSNRYSYGYIRNTKRLYNEILLLPIDAHNNPDWAYMEEVGKALYNSQTSQLKKYLIQKREYINLNIIPDFNEINWGHFFVGDIFEFRNKKTKGLSSLEKQPHGISYVGATNRNNGIVEFVEPIKEMIYDGNCIVFIKNGEGAMGYSVYKKEDFIATQDVSVGYNENLNKYTGLFITTLADRARGKYNFSYKRNIKRLKNEILQLPVNENNEIDWQYMEDYMKQIEYSHLEKLINYLS